MSQPADPYRQRPAQPGHPHQGRPQQPYPQPYQQPYGDGRHQRDQYQGDPYQRDPHPYQQQPPPPQRRPEPYRPAPSRGPSVARRLLGPGLLLIVIALVIQLLSMTVLPWEGGLSMPEFWQRTSDEGTSGFGDWYVVLFGYPLTVLSILLALASVLESVAVKLVWGGLAIVGLGVLVLRYGFGPFADLAGGRGFDFSTQEITIVTVAVGALVVVIFLLKMAVTTFRRVAGLVLLAVSGVHVSAVWNLPEQVDLGAYGPAAGYLLTAIAAFIGPRRFM